MKEKKEFETKVVSMPAVSEPGIYLAVVIASFGNLRVNVEKQGRTGDGRDRNRK